LLHALPSQHLEATATGLSALSQQSYQINRANVFLLRVPITVAPSVSAQFKAGYTGSAKVPLGWRPTAYVATRRFLAYLRTRWLF
jgi:hypothetical protein